MRDRRFYTTIMRGEGCVASRVLLFLGPPMLEPGRGLTSRWRSSVVEEVVDKVGLESKEEGMGGALVTPTLTRSLG